MVPYYGQDSGARGVGGIASYLKNYRQLPPPRAITTPDDQQPIITGKTKESLFAPTDLATDIGLSEPGTDPRRTTLAEDIGLPSDEELRDRPGVADEDESHLFYGTPTSGGMQRYNPARGIEAFAGGNFMSGAPGMRPGTPGGGAFSGSSTPVNGVTAMGNPSFDWSGVANPEMFEGYGQPNRDAARAADLARSKLLATDPLAEKRAEADIWTNAQLRLQTGIQSAIMGDYQRRLDDIQERVKREMPGAPASDVAKEIQRRVAALQDDYTTMFGKSGAGSAVRVPSSRPF